MTRFIHKTIFIFLISILFNPQADAIEEIVIDGSPTVLITNVTIYDGTGAMPFKGQVRIKGDRILTVESDKVPQIGSDNQIIDGMGLDLAPGFIDTHSHHDIGLDKEPEASAVITQGVTTIVRGMDGFSEGFQDANYFSVRQFAEYFQSIPIAINVASFSAHNSIRLEVMEEDFRREASVEEIEQMSSLVDLDMRSGAYGLSTGLEYDPGIFASTDEVIELAKVSGGYQGKYKSHIRSEDREYWEAIDETIEIGRQAKIPVNIDHFKLNGRFNWGRTDEILSILNAAREEGINVTTDVYPYEAWSSSIATLYPERNFDDPVETKFILDSLSSAEDITFVYHTLHPEYVQKTVAEIARENGKTEVQMLSELSKESYTLGSAASPVEYVVAKGMLDSDIRLLLNWDYSNVTSDGELVCSHPRGCGTFPRVISKYRGEDGIGSLERIIYKMTLLSATNIGLKDRGVIKAGAFADLVLFDADNTKDNATFSDSTLKSEGIHSVWVNGIRVLNNGEPSGELPGRILLKNKE